MPSQTGPGQPPRVRAAYPGEHCFFDLGADVRARAQVDAQQVGPGHDAGQPAGEPERDRQPPNPVPAHEARRLLDGGLLGDGDGGCGHQLRGGTGHGLAALAAARPGGQPRPGGGQPCRLRDEVRA
jgi:hypothetical protein